MSLHGASPWLVRINRHNPSSFEQIRLRAAEGEPFAFDRPYRHLSANDWDLLTERWNAKRGYGTIADEAAGPCGFVVGIVDEGDVGRVNIAGLWVAPQRRRSGIGRKLVGAVNDWAAWAGASTVCVQLASDNIMAAAFFTDFGFTKAVVAKHHEPADFGMCYRVDPSGQTAAT